MVSIQDIYFGSSSGCVIGSYSVCSFREFVYIPHSQYVQSVSFTVSQCIQLTVNLRYKSDIQNVKIATCGKL